MTRYGSESKNDFKKNVVCSIMLLLTSYPTFFKLHTAHLVNNLVITKVSYHRIALAVGYIILVRTSLKLADGFGGSGKTGNILNLAITNG